MHHKFWFKLKCTTGEPGFCLLFFMNNRPDWSWRSVSLWAGHNLSCGKKRTPWVQWNTWVQTWWWRLESRVSSTCQKISKIIEIAFAHFREWKIVSVSATCSAASRERSTHNFASLIVLRAQNLCTDGWLVAVPAAAMNSPTVQDQNVSLSSNGFKLKLKQKRLKIYSKNIQMTKIANREQRFERHLFFPKSAFAKNDKDKTHFHMSSLPCSFDIFQTSPTPPTFTNPCKYKSSALFTNDRTGFKISVSLWKAQICLSGTNDDENRDDSCNIDDSLQSICPHDRLHPTLQYRYTVSEHGQCPHAVFKAESDAAKSQQVNVQ